MNARQAIGHANYRGDVTESIARDIADCRPFGPNYMGEFMWPVDSAYDAELDTTRVGFSLLAPAVAR